MAGREDLLQILSSKIRVVDLPTPVLLRIGRRHCFHLRAVPRQPVGITVDIRHALERARRVGSHALGYRKVLMIYRVYEKRRNGVDAVPSFFFYYYHQGEVIFKEQKQLAVKHAATEILSHAPTHTTRTACTRTRTRTTWTQTQTLCAGAEETKIQKTKSKRVH